MVACRYFETKLPAIWKVPAHKNDTDQSLLSKSKCSGVRCSRARRIYTRVHGPPAPMKFHRCCMGLKDTENLVRISVSKIREISTFELETQPYVVARERAASTLRSAMPRYNACVRCDS
mmetsp:Transcript_3234/g.6285  ORF Transcript_3234/g.6285 Transcript_3234/m.6285 type:complete len:119 (-) Transcript_3234:351-707(-)